MSELENLYNLIEKIDQKIENLIEKMDKNKENVGKLESDIRLIESADKSCREKQDARWESISAQVHGLEQRTKEIETKIPSLMPKDAPQKARDGVIKWSDLIIKVVMVGGIIYAVLKSGGKI